MATAKFTQDGILDATAEEVLVKGSSVTIGDVSRRLGAPSGSIYHRFPSREDLLVRLWLRSVGRFHEAYLAAGRHKDPEQALVDMALCVASFTAQHQADAVGMTLYKQSRLVEIAPEARRGQVRTINDAVQRRLVELTRRRYPRATQRRLALVRVAAVESPYGLVRPYVWTTVPNWMAGAIEASTRAILRLGDRPAPRFSRAAPRSVDRAEGHPQV